MKYSVSNLVLKRIGDTDDVTVDGIVNDKPYSVHVWYSHLYGKNANSLNGDSKKIKTYIQQELVNAYKADPENVETIEL